MKPRNRRLTTLWFVGGAALFLLAVTVAGLLLEERPLAPTGWAGICWPAPWLASR